MTNLLTLRPILPSDLLIFFEQQHDRKPQG